MDTVQRYSTLSEPAETLKLNHFKSSNFKDVTETLSPAQKRRRRKKGKDTHNNGYIHSKETDPKSSEHTSETVIQRKKREKEN